MHYIYVIKNRESQKIYIGQTKNLQQRLLRHNNLQNNKKTSFTSKNHGDWRYVYVEGYNTRQEVRLREIELKSSRGRDFVKNYGLEYEILGP